MKPALQFVLRMYQRWVSPMLPHSCRFVPTCSEYAMDAIERHGALRGSWLAAGRLLRCRPFARWGYDPVPLTGKPTWKANRGQTPRETVNLSSAGVNGGTH